MLKEKFTYIKFISIQNGTRFVTGDILEKLEKGNKKYKIDFYFTFNNCYSEIMSKYIEGSYKVIGSYKNNFFNISKNYQKNTLCYISRMSDIFLEYSKKKNLNLLKKNYMPWEIKLVEYINELLKNINIYCEKKNINLNILGSSPNSVLEKNFFNNIFKKDSFNFIPKNKMYDSYKNIDKYEVLINPMSTFGYEALAREKKVCFFSGDFINGSSFIWPLSDSKKGNFFTNSNTLDEVSRVIDYLFNIDDKAWVNEISTFNKKLFL